jgi:hypothetical protein
MGRSGADHGRARSRFGGAIAKFVAGPPPGAEPLSEPHRLSLRRACDRVGVTRLRRILDIPEGTFRRALKGEPIVLLSRLKLEAFVAKWRQENE